MLESRRLRSSSAGISTSKKSHFLRSGASEGPAHSRRAIARLTPRAVDWGYVWSRTDRVLGYGSSYPPKPPPTQVPGLRIGKENNRKKRKKKALRIRRLWNTLKARWNLDTDLASVMISIKLSYNVIGEESGPANKH